MGSQSLTDVDGKVTRWLVTVYPGLYIVIKDTPIASPFVFIRGYWDL